ncbi:hypothetical protein IL252_04755 [Halomicrobium sp. IBSBa]|uniref:Uncharacterized protein n=1 Tax=Halomicrobium mukohataei TaxID=57705 RepID=A0A847U517_9EURY|nr:MULTISPECIES: hypothetical protein [Halomicrobium]MBO4247128.1 hypothetical protein [Halomicrobium sp. IBSBa]NLV08415.1 hypothetical protein [Halomicrobium mukohataei]
MSFLRPSRRSFAVAVGTATAVLVGVPAVAFFRTAVVALIPLSIALLCGIAAAVLALRVPSLPATLVRARVHLGVLVVPLAVLVLAPFFFPPLDLGGSPDDGLLLGLIAVLVASAVIYVATTNRYAALLTGTDSPIAEWRSRPDERYCRRVRIATLVGGIIAIASMVFVHTPFVGVRPGIGGMLIGQSIFYGRSRTYQLFDEGLLIRASGTVVYQFVPAGQLSSVEHGTDALSIRRSLPWPFPIRCAIDDLADPDDLLATLGDAIGRRK